ncbi:hypothetical protein AQUCO_01700485v1 [Aquilegia coerulea]|uniref:Uncharacterized protein n=1 Tax=Aquilegia coerulea TaxID=218851 RepID=A0A2G5DN45_AQUCA|nr:hypothetical protein AQUCO_01700485v1 [Aquilegia coerulea]
MTKFASSVSKPLLGLQVIWNVHLDSTTFISTWWNQNSQIIDGYVINKWLSHRFHRCQLVPSYKCVHCSSYL